MYRVEIDGKDYLDAIELAEHEHVSRNTARRLMLEIEALEQEGYYPKWATYRMGAKIFRVSYLVMRHYLKYADHIKIKEYRHLVPAFDPREIKEFLGVDRVRLA